MSAAAHTLHQVNTRCNADSVEFVPATYAVEGDDDALRTFVCGNYQLNEETREKFGRIYLYQVKQGASEDATVTAASASSDVPPPAVANADYPLIQQQVFDTDAIFDLKW